MFSEFDASGVAQALTEPVADEAVAESLFRPMRLSGRYDAEHQFLLDMMVHDGQVGYHVLTPLRRDGVAVLVNRGWVAANADRTVIPELKVGAGNRDVSGMIAPLPRAGLQLDQTTADSATPWPRRLTFPSAADIRGQLNYRVAGYQVLLDPQEPDGFVRDWRPTVMGPGKHLSYAVQWFGLAAALVVIFVVVNLERGTGPDSS